MHAYFTIKVCFNGRFSHCLFKYTFSKQTLLENYSDLFRRFFSIFIRIILSKSQNVKLSYFSQQWVSKIREKIKTQKVHIWTRIPTVLVIDNGSVLANMTPTYNSEQLFESLHCLKSNKYLSACLATN